ncbi:MAG: SPOR domain-containing protein [Balneolaceae bacterium]
MEKTPLVYILLAITLLAAQACATSEPVDGNAGGPVTYSPADDEESAPPIFDLTGELLTAYFDDFDIDEMSEEEQMLYYSRTSLKDIFDRETHDMPEFYLQEVEEEEVDIYQGFRIQILSTRDVGLADSTMIEFESWADTTFADYSPRGYIHFRPPYYRVRIGDFHNRDRAIEFSRLLKSNYPDAWIIHDQVNPYRVPSDTLEFRIADFEDNEERGG